MAGIYFNSGQLCSATSRLIVHETVAEVLYAALAERIDAIRLGDPLSPTTDMGPLTSARQRDGVQRYLDIAAAEQLVAVRDDSHRKLPDQGYFLAPTLYRDVPVTSRLWREEIFWPVLCGCSVASEEEAIELANDSDFGLAATIISGDNERAQRIGRELGPWGLAAYLEVKHVIGPAA